MITVNQADCQGCGDCVDVCPQGAIRLTTGRAEIDRTRCDGCGLCIDACPTGAIRRDELAVVHPDRIIPVRPVSQQRTGVLTAIGSALSYIGTEIVPRALPIVLDVLEQRAAAHSGLSQTRAAREPDSGGYGRRRLGARRRRDAVWPSDGMCICPRCGHRERHRAGVPCRTLSCPQCGCRLVRQ